MPFKFPDLKLFIAQFNKFAAKELEKYATKDPKKLPSPLKEHYLFMEEILTAEDSSLTDLLKIKIVMGTLLSLKRMNDPAITKSEFFANADKIMNVTQEMTDKDGKIVVKANKIDKQEEEYLIKLYQKRSMGTKKSSFIYPTVEELKKNAVDLLKKVKTSHVKNNTAIGLPRLQQMELIASLIIAIPPEDKPFITQDNNLNIPQPGTAIIDRIAADANSESSLKLTEEVNEIIDSLAGELEKVNKIITELDSQKLSEINNEKEAIRRQQTLIENQKLKQTLISKAMSQIQFGRHYRLELNENNVKFILDTHFYMLPQPKSKFAEEQRIKEEARILKLREETYGKEQTLSKKEYKRILGENERRKLATLSIMERRKFGTGALLRVKQLIQNEGSWFNWLNKSPNSELFKNIDEAVGNTKNNPLDEIAEKEALKAFGLLSTLIINPKTGMLEYHHKSLKIVPLNPTASEAKNEINAEIERERIEKARIEKEKKEQESKLPEKLEKGKKAEKEKEIVQELNKSWPNGEKATPGIGIYSSGVTLNPDEVLKKNIEKLDQDIRFEKKPKIINEKTKVKERLKDELHSYKEDEAGLYGRDISGSQIILSADLPNKNELGHYFGSYLYVPKRYQLVLLTQDNFDSLISDDSLYDYPILVKKKHGYDLYLYAKNEWVLMDKQGLKILPDWKFSGEKVSVTIKDELYSTLQTNNTPSIPDTLYYITAQYEHQYIKNDDGKFIKDPKGNIIRKTGAHDVKIENMEKFKYQLADLMAEEKDLKQYFNPDEAVDLDYKRSILSNDVLDNLVQKDRRATLTYKQVKELVSQNGGTPLHSDSMSSYVRMQKNIALYKQEYAVERKNAADRQTEDEAKRDPRIIVDYQESQETNETIPNKIAKCRDATKEEIEAYRKMSPNKTKTIGPLEGSLLTKENWTETDYVNDDFKKKSLDNTGEKTTENSKNNSDNPALRMVAPSELINHKKIDSNQNMSLKRKKALDMTKPSSVSPILLFRENMISKNPDGTYGKKLVTGGKKLNPVAPQIYEQTTTTNGLNLDTEATLLNDLKLKNKYEGQPKDRVNFKYNVENVNKLFNNAVKQQREVVGNNKEKSIETHNIGIQDDHPKLLRK